MKISSIKRQTPDNYLLSCLQDALEKNNEATTNRFYSACYEKLFGKIFAISYSRFSEIAEDVTNDIFTKIMHKVALEKFPIDSEKHLENYILKIAYNHCTDVYRIRSRASFTELTDGMGDEKISWDSVNRVDWSMDLKALIERLPTRQRLVIGYWSKGYPYEEIAELLDLTVNAVRNLIYRARKNLKDYWTYEHESVQNHMLRKCV